MPSFYRKRSGTTYLQTWHGTPLKRIAFDIPGRTFANRPEYLRDLSRDIAKWDALVSPNPLSTEVMRRAFRYDGEVLETGYPRNDLLLDPRRAEIRRRVRDELGIPEASRAVLYAPTWRDSHAFSLELDVARLLGELDGHFLLLRLHQLVDPAAGLAADPRFRDVSTYTDNRELFLAADVLVTDYSSVMFDFAVTGKPMLFYTYDLDSYRDEVRGFTFDFEREAPGPLCRDTGELIEELGELDAVIDRFRPGYEAFRARFCGLEDGRAAARVIDAVFG
jgi:CDP-glycerol glycerophosphotransferase